MTIEQIELQPVLFLKPETSIEDAFKTIDRAGYDGALVEGENGEIGAVSYFEIWNLTQHKDVDLTRPIGSFASLCTIVLTGESDLQAALQTMRRHRLDVAPVTRDGQTVGLVSRDAITKALREKLRARMKINGGKILEGEHAFQKSARRRVSK